MMKKIVKTPIITNKNDMSLSLPITVHIELTYSCELRCRHCYNFWRKKETKPISMTKKQLDSILDELLKNRIMHVIFTGGEPFLNYEVLLHGIKRMKEADGSVSCNSSLIVGSTLKNMKKLRNAGLEHILTSLNSHIEKVNDYLVSTPGSFKKTIRGMKNAVSAGIRISVNMIISKSNIEHIYETAKLAHMLGAKKFFATRVVPNPSNNIEEQKEFWIYKDDARYILNELLRVENDFDMQVGTLVPYPFCTFEKDRWDKFKNYYTHGCPAGNKMMSINANGDAHACVHESKTYGNIFETGIKEIWNNMKEWRSGEIFPDECKECEKYDDCNGACRLSALFYKKDIKATDNLMIGWYKNNKEKKHGEKLSDSVLTNRKYTVSNNLRFRKEKGFYVVNRFGSEILCVKDNVAKILQKYQKNGESFKPSNEGLKDGQLIQDLINEDLIIQYRNKN